MTYSYGVVIVNLEYISYLFSSNFYCCFEQVIICRVTHWVIQDRKISSSNLSFVIAKYIEIFYLAKFCHVKLTKATTQRSPGKKTTLLIFENSKEKIVISIKKSTNCEHFAESFTKLFEYVHHAL